MKYIRSDTLNQALSLDGLPLGDSALVADRQALIDQFNSVMGSPGEVVAAVQADFVSGTMPYDDMVSHVRFCEYMICTAQKLPTTDSE